MFQNIRDGKFAIGLVLGIGLTVIFFAFMLTEDQSRNSPDMAPLIGANAQVQENRQSGDGLNAWWRWDGSLITSSDTAAQWIMMVFSIVAALLLFGTLIATQRMAKDTRTIGQDQSRAYIHADKAHFFWGGSRNQNPRVEIWIRNTGQTPAKWYEIKAKECVFAHNGEDSDAEPWRKTHLPDQFDGPWNAVPADSKGRKATFYFNSDEQVAEINKASRDEPGIAIPTHGFCVVGEVRYETFFGEIFTSQFVFGRSVLPPYKLKETRTRKVKDITVNENIEEPVPLVRFSGNIKAYEKI